MLILTDYTPTCFWSVTYGLDFCRHYGLSPEILHVELPSPHPIIDDVERKKVQETVDLYNNRFNLGATVVIKCGTLSEVISKETAAGNFRVIILVTHGKQGFQSVTGSAAAKIISSLNIPIIVMQGKRFSPLEKAVLPVFSDTVNSNVLANYGDLIRRLRISVDLVCRKENIEICHRLSRMFDESSVSEIERKANGFSFVRQVIQYAENNNADLIIGLPPGESSQQYLDFMEQLLFNIPQIPVLCR